MNNEMPDDGSLPAGPFVEVIMRGFVGKPIHSRAIFDAEKLFGHPQIVEIVQDACVQVVKATLVGAVEGNIFLLKAKPEGDL